jgi:NAD(P)-dependent dehydrogenase (short-subunit alcohol dehydrogenase family)
MADRIILVSGASGGLGEFVTEAFLDAGDTVVGLARSWRKPPANPRFTPVAADLNSSEGCRKAVADALAARGHLHALIHCLGGFAGGQSTAGTSDETWDGMLALNLTAAFHLCRAVLPALTTGGRIIAVGSRAGVLPAANLSAYNVSKAGLHALIQTIAAEAKGALTANVVMPSTIDTPANRAAMPNADPSQWVAPQRIASLILWLASPEAADVNGALIPIYGRA